MLETIRVENPRGLNLIMGESRGRHILDVIRNQLTANIPEIQFGMAFNDSTSTSSLRYGGTNPELVDLARRNAGRINAGNTFFLFVEDVNSNRVMRALKEVHEIYRIHCATPNPIEIVIGQTPTGRGVMGLVDDYSYE